MRIAYITSEFPPDTGKGGIGTYVSQVSSMLAGGGWDVHVFAASNHRDEDIDENGVHVHWIKCADPHHFRHGVVARFSELHTAAPFDLIESSEIHGNAAEIKKAFPDLPLVVRLHAPDWLVEHTKKKYYPVVTRLRPVVGALRRGKIDLGYWREYDAERDLDRQFAMMADSLTAPSSVMKDWAVTHWGISSRSITTIPNPFSPSEAFTELPIASAENMEVVFFGRLNVLKGLVNATHAMRKILKAHPACRFKVIGDDGPGPDQKASMREWMRAQLKSVLERVEFSDGLPYDAIPRAIADANVALLPSLFESFSYTCAEAMAAGKAVVGSRGTGMQDMIENESTGILIDPDNPADIVDAVNRLLIDPGLTRRISLAARARIANRFGGEQTAQLFMDYYRGVARS